MSIANFEQLCGGFCEIAGIEMPDLPVAADANGMWSATLRMRGVEITLMQYEHRRPGTVFFIADFGAMPVHAGLQAWLVLMDANLMHSGADSPTYGRNPKTGHVLLQKPLRLEAVCAADVYETVSALVDTAVRWRHDCFASDADAAFRLLLPQGMPPCRATEEWASASEDFSAFHRGLFEALGQEPLEMPDPDPGHARAFEVQVSGVNFTLAHAAQEHPDWVWLAVHLGQASRNPSPDLVQAAMDANFTLMAMTQDAKFSRLRDTGELLLQCAVPLKRADPRKFLGELKSFANLALDLVRVPAANHEPSPQR